MATRGLKIAEVIQSVSLAFLSGSLDAELAKESRRDQEIWQDKRGKKHLVGEFGEVLVNL